MEMRMKKDSWIARGDYDLAAKHACYENPQKQFLSALMHLCHWAQKLQKQCWNPSPMSK